MTPAELRALPLGTRVVVRYRLHGDAHKATDALGELAARDAVTCTVATRSGRVVIAVADIIAAKTVPPPPEPRIRRPPA
jgi:hypothetical protein